MQVSTDEVARLDQDLRLAIDVLRQIRQYGRGVSRTWARKALQEIEREATSPVLHTRARSGSAS
jgi:hypothetical protein